MVQLGVVLFKVMLICADWCSLVELGADWYNLILICRSWCKLLQNGAVWFRLVHLVADYYNLGNLVKIGATWCSLV